jgi:cobalt-zinc-cadmium efflux system outer membrane protein
MRARVAVLLVVSASTVAGASNAPVTEPEAIRLFLETSVEALRGPAIVQAVEAASRLDARIVNPEVTYQVEDAAGVRDEFLTFRQTLPVTGRRALKRDGADAEVSAAQLSTGRYLLEAALAVRASFYEVLYQDHRVDRMRRGVVRLERIVHILEQREREGEGSGYDVLRAEQELAEASITVSRAEAERSIARSRFASFFDPSSDMRSARLEGELAPAGALPEAGAAVDRALMQRGDLAALRSRAERHELDRRAARRERFPEPTLTAGWKRTEALGLDDTGFVASVTLPLPVFNRGQLGERRASAERQRAELEVVMLEREIRADVEAALARERAAREAIERHGRDAEARAEELLTIAELLYDEGEAGILELLDAYRTSLATELRALTLQYEAKRAEIDRQRAVGNEVQP